jgi:hypothetical protein
MPTKEDNSVDEARDDNLDVYVPVEASFLRNSLLPNLSMSSTVKDEDEDKNNGQD